ncbi:MAG: hypothetical protein PEPC_01679 [Peptostreptococcus russellii]
MGKILPGIFIAFENPKGGAGKSTLTALFAGYLHSSAKDTGLKVGVIDIDDAQNSIGKMRISDSIDEDVNEEYNVMNISSADIRSQIEYLQESFDIILIDFPGSLKQKGVIDTLMIIDILIIPFEPSKIEVSSTLDFYEFYAENILKIRNAQGYKTIVKGLPNRVLTNLLEYKDIVAAGAEGNLPFALLNNHIKESRVNLQRNLSTLMKDYDNTYDAFGTEVLDIITEYIKN